MWFSAHLNLVKLYTIKCTPTAHLNILRGVICSTANIKKNKKQSLLKYFLMLTKLTKHCLKFKYSYWEKSQMWNWVILGTVETLSTWNHRWQSRRKKKAKQTEELVWQNLRVDRIQLHSSQTLSPRMNCLKPGGRVQGITFDENHRIDFCSNSRNIQMRINPSVSPHGASG